ncbi:hypothetical protein [Clostridium paridis]|uniref:Lipoprotein n=1 Tax=Clostridium paridis TaxID=2803863 RepID=A0A937FJY4_9CLOT|nr:hypothetical protein [Clostridium paridis]MBL4933817.1 hypothetical protein [Clostridium paridis]
MRKVILSIGTVLSIMLFVLIGCSNTNNKKISDKIIGNPDKILVYKDGNKKEILSSDSNFEKIVNLTNDRIDKESISVAKDGVDIDKTVNDNKKYLGVEFIYNEEQKMDIKNSNGFSPIKYYKLFFSLDIKNNPNTDYFQYGTEEKYVDSSRGPIKSPDKVINIINNI